MLTVPSGLFGLTRCLYKPFVCLSCSNQIYIYSLWQWLQHRQAMAPPRYAPYVPRMRPASRTPMECSRCRAICWREPSPHTCAGERAVVSLAPAVLVASAGERAVVSLAPAVPVASAQPERSLCWQRLPRSAAAALRSASVCTIQELMDLSTVALDQLVAE